MRTERRYSSLAVVLRRDDLGEADRIVTLYTRDHGKVRAIAKGSRRTTSRSAGHLELFSAAMVALAVGRDLDVIVEADTVRAFRPVRERLDLSSFGYYLTELTNALTADRLPNADVYDALVEAFARLEQGREMPHVAIAFLLRVLHALGYRPELARCLTCRDMIVPGDNHFSAVAGGVLCSECGRRELAARPITTDALKLMRFLQRTAGRQGVAAPPRATAEAESLLRDYAETVVERRMRVPGFIASVNRVAAGAATSGLAC